MVYNGHDTWDTWHNMNMVGMIYGKCVGDPTNMIIDSRFLANEHA